MDMKKIKKIRRMKVLAMPVSVPVSVLFGCDLGDKGCVNLDLIYEQGCIVYACVRV